MNIEFYPQELLRIGLEVAHRQTSLRLEGLRATKRSQRQGAFTKRTCRRSRRPVLPLAIATGAAAEMRQALGTAVFFGMLGVTFFGLIFTPVFYVVARKLARN